MAQCKLIRPLDGNPIGAIVEYDELDAKHLEDHGLVTIVKAAEAPKNKMAEAPSNKGKGK